MPYKDFHLRLVLLRQEKRDENNCCEDRHECFDDQTALTKPYGQKVTGGSVTRVFFGGCVQVSLEHALEPQSLPVLMDRAGIHTHRRRRYEALNFGKSIFRHIQKITGLQVSVLF